MLGAWAEQTSRIQIGALVTCNSYRNPELLADMARTVDHIGDGRLILGIGSGWKDRDYHEYGYEFGTAGNPARRPGRRPAANQDPAVPAQSASHPAYSVADRRGGERKTLRLVAEHADMWHSFTDADTYPHKAAILAEHCAALGRDPATIEHSTALGNDHTEAELLAAAESMAELGVSLLTVGSSGPDYDLTAAEALCRWRDQR